jgi:hypothetical protein
MYKNCGSCRFWEKIDQGDRVPIDSFNLGACRFPLPYFMVMHNTYAGSGGDCRAHEEGLSR